MIYEVAGIFFNIHDFILTDSAWRLFQVDYEKNDHVDIEVEFANICNSGIYANVEMFEDMRNGDKMLRRDEDLMLIRGNWSYVKIFPARCVENIYAFLIQSFYSHAIHRKMVQLHSSSILYKGRGILFLGSSGIGKTTQAELWNQKRNALIINGDMNFVQEDSEKFWAWGTPWHGKSPYCVNTRVPICALIVLKQSEKNMIRELYGFEKVSIVSRSVFYPEWIENGIELCLELLDHLLSALPVYELSCRPDEEAVKLTESIVFGRE